MTDFITDESSVETSRPEEGYEIAYTNITYRLASADRDVVIDGNRYNASPIYRSEIVLTTGSGDRELSVTLPIAHAVPQRYIRNGVPPRTVYITIRRQQQVSGIAEQVYAGVVTSMSIDWEKHTASFRVPTRSGDAMQKRLPQITVGRDCLHVLYDSQCAVPRSGAFKVTTTVVSINGRVVGVASDGGQSDGFFKFGELVHVSSGERMTIFDHTGDVFTNDMTLQAPIAELAVGDVVEIYAGCDHTVGTCKLKFDNMPNFGGFPQLPAGNVFTKNGLGLYVTP